MASVNPNPGFGQSLSATTRSILNLNNGSPPQPPSHQQLMQQMMEASVTNASVVLVVPPLPSAQQQHAAAAAGEGLSTTTASATGDATMMAPDLTVTPMRGHAGGPIAAVGAHSYTSQRSMDVAESPLIHDHFAATEVVAGGGGGFYQHPALLGATIQRAGNRVLTMETYGVPLSAVLEQHVKSLETAVDDAASAATTGAQRSKPTSPLTPAVIRQVVGQVAEALRFLHSRGICHGAITLDRVFVQLASTPGGVPGVKLGGLDRLRFAKDLVTLGQHGALPAPGMESCPEAHGIPIPAGFPKQAPEERFMLADMWQLGLLMHRLLFEGRLPFDDNGSGRPRFIANQKGGYFRWDSRRIAACPLAHELPRLRSALPKLLTHAGKRFSAWRLDALLTQWSVLHQFGYEVNDDFDRSKGISPSNRTDYSGGGGTARHSRTESEANLPATGMEQDVSASPSENRVGAKSGRRNAATDGKLPTPGSEGNLADLGRNLSNAFDGRYKSLHAAICDPDGAHLGAVVALLQISVKRNGIHDPTRPRNKFNKATALHDALSLIDQNASMDTLVPLVQLLMASTRDPGGLLEIQDNAGTTPLMLAITRRPRNLPLFTLLLDLGHRKGTLSILANKRVINYAVQHDLTQFVKELLTHWHDLDFPNPQFIRLLEGSAANGAADTCGLQLRMMPHNLRKDAIIRAMLTAAAHSRQVACEALFKFAADDEDASHADLSEIATAALFAACENNLMDLVEMAVLHRALPIAYNSEGTTCAHIAAAAGFDSSLRTLFTHIPKESALKLVSLVDASGRTPLHLACLNGQGPACSILLDNGADPNAADRERWTPLHLAAMKGWGGICSKLIGWNAWAEPKLLDGSTPTLLAAASGEIECIRDALLPNGCALASEYETNYRTAYDELLLSLYEATEKLNRLDTYNLRKVLIVLAMLYPVCVAGTAVAVEQYGTGGFNWATLGFIASAFVAHAAIMLGARESLTAAQKENQEFFDSLLPVRTVLRSVSSSVPEHRLEQTEEQVRRFMRELHNLQAEHVQSLSSQEAAVAKAKLENAANEEAAGKPTFPWNGTKKDKSKKKQKKDDTEALIPQAPMVVKLDDAAKTNDAKDSMVVAKRFAKQLRAWVRHFPSTVGGPPTVFTSTSVPAQEGIDYINNHVKSAVDPVRQLAIRQALHAVLHKAEADADALSLASPFVSRQLFVIYVKAVMKAHGELLFLRIISTFVMIIIFATLATIMFTKEGAVAFHFSNKLADECVDSGDLRCTDFMTANDWLSLSSPDCCFGATEADARCPGNISSITATPAPPPLTTAAPTTTTTAAPSATTAEPVNELIVPLETERIFYIRSAAHDTTYPTTKITVKACTLTDPRPQMTVNTILREGRVSTVAATIGSTFLMLGGAGLFITQLAVAYRWARRRTVTYQLSGNDSYQASLSRYYLLSTLHTIVATLCFILAVRRLNNAPLAELETLGVGLGLLSTYPGMAIVTWLPKMGHVISPILLQAYLGLLFVLGMITFFQIIPAINSFAIPFFVTDPQRAIVSFSSATSSRTFYVAICVFWLLLLFRMFMAAAGALAPSDARAHYFEFFRESRVLVAKQLPSRRSSATSTGDEEAGNSLILGGAGPSGNAPYGNDIEVVSSDDAGFSDGGSTSVESETGGNESRGASPGLNSAPAPAPTNTITATNNSSSNNNTPSRRASASVAAMGGESSPLARPGSVLMRAESIRRGGSLTRPPAARETPNTTAVQRQPCPSCGRSNKVTNRACIGCKAALPIAAAAAAALNNASFTLNTNDSILVPIGGASQVDSNTAAGMLPPPLRRESELVRTRQRELPPTGAAATTSETPDLRHSIAGAGGVSIASAYPSSLLRGSGGGRPAQPPIGASVVSDDNDDDVPGRQQQGTSSATERRSADPAAVVTEEDDDEDHVSIRMRTSIQGEPFGGPRGGVAPGSGNTTTKNGNTNNPSSRKDTRGGNNTEGGGAAVVAT